MAPNHSGRPKLKVILKCLDLVKTYGKSPRKLVNSVKMNSEQKTPRVPGRALGPNRAPNSEFIYINIFLRVSWN